MPSVTLVETYEQFPQSIADRKSLAAGYAERLVQEWVDAGLTMPKVFHLLVHRPGEIGRTPEQALHRGDEAGALEHERGGVAVAVSLTDVLDGAEEFLVLQITQT